MYILDKKLSKTSEPTGKWFWPINASTFPDLLQWLTVHTFNSCSSRPDVRYSLVLQTPIYNMSKDKPNACKTHEACESKLRLVVRSSMHPYPGEWVAFGHFVMYHAWAARELRARIKCLHCSCSTCTGSIWH